MKRFFDICFSFFSCLLLFMPMSIIAVMIKCSSKGSVLYWSDRVGRDNHLFKMPKFRTMQIDTPAVATHLLSDPDRYLFPVGKFLRKTSLDELPQFLSILKGDMSFVGPRPALFNQEDLIEQRTSKGIHVLLPGLTGWAQINGRDEIPISVKVEYDFYYFENHSFLLDCKIIFITFLKTLRNEGVSH